MSFLDKLRVWWQYRGISRRFQRTITLYNCPHTPQHHMIYQCPATYHAMLFNSPGNQRSGF